MAKEKKVSFKDKISEKAPICIQSQVFGQTKAILDCVDAATGEVVKQYIFNINSDKPIIDRIVPISSKKGVTQTFKLQLGYTNPFAQKSSGYLFNLQSSNPAILVPSKEVETSPEAEIKIKPQQRPGKYEAIVHINTKEGEHEAVLFIINI